MTNSAQLKSECIDVHATIEIKQLLQEAANVCQKNLDEFLLEAGILAANQALAERRRLGLDKTQWEKFLRILDRPVQSKPHLNKLLTQPSVVESTA